MLQGFEFVRIMKRKDLSNNSTGETPWNLKNKQCYNKKVNIQYYVYSLFVLSNTVKALISGHPRDAKKVSVTGAGR